MTVSPLGAGSFIESDNLVVFYRTDYHIATPAVAASARTESIYKTQRFSDHAPITVEYDFAL